VFRCGAEHGGENPLLCCSHPFGLVRTCPSVGATSAVVCLSVQLEVLRKVSWTFLRFMISYILLLIAFALSFFILFKGSSEVGDMFSNPFLSLLKTIVMFTGELEVSNLTFQIFPYTSHVIFLLFVFFLVATVLLNLLNGLAVNDTELIRKDAETLSIVARVRLISKIEKVLRNLPTFMTPDKLTDEVLLIYPNRRNPIEHATVQAALGIVSKRRRKSGDVQNVWTEVKERLSALHLRQVDLEKKFEAKFEEMRQLFVQILNSLQSAQFERIPAEI
jgi:hypothetical protein